MSGCQRRKRPRQIDLADATWNRAASTRQDPDERDKTRNGGRCNCLPSWRASIWNPDTKKLIRRVSAASTPRSRRSCGGPMPRRPVRWVLFARRRS